MISFGCGESAHSDDGTAHHGLRLLALHPNFQLLAVEVENEQPDGRGEIAVLAIGIDVGQQGGYRRMPISGDFLERAPERVFQADARLVPCKDYRSLDDKRLHDNQTPHVASLLQRRDIGAVK